jgi:hypothetical protein
MISVQSPAKIESEPGVYGITNNRGPCESGPNLPSRWRENAALLTPLLKREWDDRQPTLRRLRRECGGGMSTTSFHVLSCSNLEFLADLRGTQDPPTWPRAVRVLAMCPFGGYPARGSLSKRAAPRAFPARPPTEPFPRQPKHAAASLVPYIARVNATLPLGNSASRTQKKMPPGRLHRALLQPGSGSPSFVTKFVEATVVGGT